MGHRGNQGQSSPAKKEPRPQQMFISKEDEWGCWTLVEGFRKDLGRQHCQKQGRDRGKAKEIFYGECVEWEDILGGAGRRGWDVGLGAPKMGGVGCGTGQWFKSLNIPSSTGT